MRTANLFLLLQAKFILVLQLTEAAKILAVFTAPSISHQIVFRQYTRELSQRHQVVVVTTNPRRIEETPKNITKIDIHDLMYTALFKTYRAMKVGEGVTMNAHFDGIFYLINVLTEEFVGSDVVDKLKGQKFDLLIIEAIHKQVLSLSHVLQIPVMMISSFGATFDYEIVGAACHPFLYPEIATQRMQNLSTVEKFRETYVTMMLKRSLKFHYKHFEDVIRKSVPDMPSIEELSDKVSTLMLNVNPIWEDNRPVPVGVSYVNGIYQWPKIPMSEEIEEFINASTNGVIYMSLGTNVHPSLLSEKIIKVILNGLSKLSHKVLLKWDQDELPGKTKNIMISKWFPQIAVLSHPKVKLFITQGGLQSTEEAIDAGVPIIGIPFLFDQWTNVEKYVRHRIGMKLEIETLTEDQFVEAVNTVIGDESYRENMVKFRTLMRDQPHKAMDLAMWWTEYAIRYSGAGHLRAPAANMPWTEYCELELLFIVLCTVASVLCMICVIFVAILKFLRRKLNFSLVFKKDKRLENCR